MIGWTKCLLVVVAGLSFLSLIEAMGNHNNNNFALVFTCRCGINAECSIVRGRQVCACLSGYRGNPLEKCSYAECETNSECGSHQICSSDKLCVSGCQSNPCGQNALCSTRNHQVICSCRPGQTGNPQQSCRSLNKDELCRNQCGKNALCDIRGENRLVCLCPQGYYGNALLECRPECEQNADCPNTRYECDRNRCRNVCDKCGKNAVCDALNHRLVNCSCPLNYRGDPFVSCSPECVTDADCTGALHCFNAKCVNLCDGVCGENANCRLRGLTPVCSCPKNMTGDPFTRCRPFEPSDLCEPNPCGQRAFCKPGYDRTGQDRPVCTCPSGYYGNALVECKKGECATRTDCGDHQDCIDFQCQDVCVDGVCGVNAICTPKNHVAVCTCAADSDGNAKIHCHPRKSIVN